MICISIKSVDKAYPKSNATEESWDNWYQGVPTGARHSYGFKDMLVFRGESGMGGGSATPFGFYDMTVDTGWHGSPKADMADMR